MYASFLLVFFEWVEGDLPPMAGVTGILAIKEPGHSTLKRLTAIMPRGCQDAKLLNILIKSKYYRNTQDE
jgi:hypothetical protein